jgi:MinD-like ATPase involved in chromosome partitioning or flagellar assembly
LIPIRVVTLAGDPEEEAEVARRITARTDVELVLRCVDRVELLACLRGADIDAVISVGAPVWFDRQGAEEASRGRVRIVGVVGGPADADRLAGLGAALLPYGAPIDEMVERCTEASVPLADLPPTQPSQPRGRIMALWGPKGAPGRTTIAVELAHEFSATHPETLLIDGDPYGGDVVQLLGIAEELPTVVWAARMAAKEELDSARLAVDLRRAGIEGPVFVPGLPRSELAAEVSEFGWKQLLQVARATYDYTVVDSGFCLEPEADPYGSPSGGRNRMTREAIRAADRVVAVCRADPIGLKNFLWAYDDLLELADRDRIVVVVNRVTTGAEREVSDLLRRHIDKRPSAYVPDRPNDVGRAMFAGHAIRAENRGSDISAAIRSIAANLGADVRSSGLLARMLRRH